MDKQLKVTLLLSAIDKVSAVVNKVTENASKGFTRLQKESDKIAKSTANVGRQAGVAGLAIAAPLILATKEAIKFEDKVADIAKVMNLEAGSAGLRKVSDEVKKLSIYLAQTPEDTAELYANIAQGGVAAAEVGKVSKIAGEIGVAFGISAGQAGESFIKLSNSMAMTIDDTKKVTDALNHLGNNTASNSAQLFEFLSSGGAGAARNLNLAGQEAAAFGSVLIANGKSASESGTIFERMMQGIMKNKDMKLIFDKAGGGLGGLMAVMERGASLNPTQQFAFFSKFGQYGTDISMFSKNLGQLKDTLGLVADETAFADSSNAEFLNRQKTMATTLQRVKTQATILAVTIGEKLMPVIARVVEKVTPFIERLADWIDANPELTQTIVEVAAGLSGFLLVVSGGAFIVSGVAKAISTFSMIMNGATQVIRVMSGAFRALNAILWANPISIIIALVVALIAVIAYCVYKTDGWGKMWNHTVNAMKLAFQLVVESTKVNFNTMVNGIMLGINKLKIAWYKFKNAMGIGDKAQNDQAIANIQKDNANRIAEIKKGHEKVAGITKQLGKEIVASNTSLKWNSDRKLSDFQKEMKVKLGIDGASTSTSVSPSSSANYGGISSMAVANSGGGGSPVTVNFSPNITMNGGAGGSKEDFMEMMRKYQPELVRLVDEGVRKNDRKKF